MEGKKKATDAATGSSIVDDLFGPKDGAANPSSAGYFSTVFPNPSAVPIPTSYIFLVLRLSRSAFSSNPVLLLPFDSLFPFLL